MKKNFSVLLASVAGYLVAAQEIPAHCKDKELKNCLLSVSQGYSICSAQDFACQCTYARDVTAKCYQGCPETDDMNYVKASIEDQCKLAQTVEYAAVRFKGDSDMQHRDDHNHLGYNWGDIPNDNVDEGFEEDDAVPLAPTESSDCGDDESDDYEEPPTSYYLKPTPRPAPKPIKKKPAPTYIPDDSWDNEQDPEYDEEEDDEEDDEEGSTTKKMFKKIWKKIKGQSVDDELTEADFKRSLDESLARAQLSPEQAEEILRAAAMGHNLAEGLNFDLLRKKKDFLKGGWKEYIPKKGRHSSASDGSGFPTEIPTEIPTDFFPVPDSTSEDPAPLPSPEPSSEEEEEDDCTPSTALDDASSEPVFSEPVYSEPPISKPIYSEPESESSDDEDDCTPSTALDPEKPSSLDFDTEIETIVESVIPDPVYSTKTAVEETTVVETETEIETFVPKPSTKTWAPEPNTEIETVVETFTPEPVYSTKTVVEETTVVETETEVETWAPKPEPDTETETIVETFTPEPVYSTETVVEDTTVVETKTEIETWVPEPEESSSESWIPEPDTEIETIVETFTPKPVYSTSTVIEETTVVETETEIETWVPDVETESEEEKPFTKPQPDWESEEPEESSTYKWVSEPDTEVETIVEAVTPKPIYSTSTVVEETTLIETETEIETWVPEPSTKSKTWPPKPKTKSSYPEPDTSVETIVETVTPKPVYSTETVVEETTVVETETEIETWVPKTSTKTWASKPTKTWVPDYDTVIETIVETFTPKPVYSTKTVVEDTTVVETKTEVETWIPEPSSSFKTKTWTPKPSYSKPVYSKPVYSEPVYSEPVYSEPVYSKPIYSKPIYSEPIYSEPIYSEPVYSEPSEPTSELEDDDCTPSTALEPTPDYSSIETFYSSDSESTSIEESSSTSVEKDPFPTDWYGGGGEDESNQPSKKKSLKEKFTEKLKKVLNKMKGLKGGSSVASADDESFASGAEEEAVANASVGLEDSILARDVDGAEVIAGLASIEQEQVKENVSPQSQPQSQSKSQIPLAQFVSGASKLVTSWVPLLAMAACLAYYDLNPVFFFLLAGVGLAYIQLYLPELVDA